MQLKAEYVLLVAVLTAVIFAALFIGPWFKQAPQQLTQSEPEVRVSYSWTFANTIGGSFQPPSGKTFLVVSLTVMNRAYISFTADPFSYMSVTVGATSYNVSSAYIFLDNYFQPRVLQYGGSASGRVLFEVPQGTTGPPIPGWRLSPGLTVRITWVAV